MVEGDTLVIETTNLTDQTSIGANGNGLRHSARMTMVERLRRVANDVVHNQLTVTDPETYPRPFTISIPLTPLDGGELLPYECHEGNGAVRNALAGERAEERALSADLARGLIRPRRGPQDDGLGAGAFGGQPRPAARQPASRAWRRSGRRPRRRPGCRRSGALAGFGVKARCPLIPRRRHPRGSRVGLTLADAGPSSASQGSSSPPWAPSAHGRRARAAAC